MHAELIHQYRLGNREALGCLIELDEQALYHFLRGRLGERDAADAAQEVFRRVIAGLPTLRDPRAYRGWLFGMALRVVREISRSYYAQKRAAAEITLRRGAPMAPSQLADASEHVRGAVETLEENLRLVVLLRYQAGLSYEEIADAAQVPVGTVSNRLHLAHGKLRQLLAGAGILIASAHLAHALGAPSAPPVPGHVASSLQQMAAGARPGRSIPRKSMALHVGVAGLIVIVAGVVGIGAFRAAGRDQATTTLASLGSPGGRVAPAASVPVDPEAVRILPQPTSIRFTGIVQDEETHLPISGADVWLSKIAENNEAAESEAPQLHGLTGPDGKYRIDGPAGKAVYELDAVAAGYVIHSFRLRIERDLRAQEERTRNGAEENVEKADWEYRAVSVPGDHDVEIPLVRLLRGARVRGRVLGPSGRPVAEATVAYGMQSFEIPTPGGAAPSEIVAPFLSKPVECRTDLQGTFVIDHVFPRGESSINVYHEEYPHLSRSVIVDRADVEITLTLLQPLTLRGCVRGVAGLPVPEAYVYPEGGRDYQPGPFLAAQDGSFLLKGLHPQTHYVIAGARGYESAFVPVERRDPGNLEITLLEAGGRIEASLRDDQGNPLEGVTVSPVGFVQDTRGTTVRLMFDTYAEGPGWSFGAPGRGPDELPKLRREVQASLPARFMAPSTMSDQDGHFELQGLPSSPETKPVLRLSKEGYQGMDIEVSRSSAQPIYVLIKMDDRK
ncbi:MAG TPA: sigma-70 family RNA polymerase sigma factor [Planctomycetota bacterium]|nr:sigma-70 family RNA polymerase sigma factor [Planctomycetota bacterium]